MPSITQQMMASQGPLMKRIAGGAMQKAVERACDEAKCSADQRKMITEMAAKVAPTS